MSDEFVEHDIETPSADELAKDYGSRFLGVEDVGTKRMKAKISKVRREEIKDRETNNKKKRAVVFFESVDKPLVLNTTNKITLEEALGKAPIGWIGATVGIYVDPSVTFGGQRKGGVRLRVLLPPAAAAKAVATPAPSTPPATAAKEWPEEKGDPGPGFDPDLNDSGPEFTAA